MIVRDLSVGNKYRPRLITVSGNCDDSFDCQKLPVNSLADPQAPIQRRTLLKAAGVAVAGLAGCSEVSDETADGGSTPQSTPDILLSISTERQTYRTDQPVSLTVSLENRGEEPTGVMEALDGTIRVESLTSNGEDVSKKSTVASYYRPLSESLAESVTSLQPGESVSMNWKTTHDSTFEGQALTTVSFGTAGTGTHDATRFDLSEPGEYRLTVVYKPPKLEEDMPTVFTRRTNEATTKFTVTTG